MKKEKSVTERLIRISITKALLDGQNQIHDLWQKTATAEEINIRVHKSIDFHSDELLKSLAKLK